MVSYKKTNPRLTKFDNFSFYFICHGYNINVKTKLRIFFYLYSYFSISINILKNKNSIVTLLLFVTSFYFVY